MWSYKKSVLHVFWKNALATSCVKTRPKALRKILERDQYISSKIVVTQSTTSYRMKDMDKIFLTIPHKPIWVKWFSCYSTSNGNLFLSIWRDDFPEYFVLYARKHQDELVFVFLMAHKQTIDVNAIKFCTCPASMNLWFWMSASIASRDSTKW